MRCCHGQRMRHSHPVTLHPAHVGHPSVIHHVRKRMTTPAASVDPRGHTIQHADRSQPTAEHAQAVELTTVHIYAISDLHCDHELNMEWLKQRMAPDRRLYPHLSVLLVAGDVSDKLPVLREALTLLKGAFWQVVYTPGNHELWVGNQAERQLDSESKVQAEDLGREEEPPILDSLDKLAAIRRLCQRLGVHMGLVRLGRLVLLPLLSWHHKSFDQEPDIPGNLVPKASRLTISDYARCIWPEDMRQLGSVEVAELLDVMNDEEDAVRLLEHVQGCRQTLSEDRPRLDDNSMTAGTPARGTLDTACTLDMTTDMTHAGQNLDNAPGNATNSQQRQPACQLVQEFQGGGRSTDQPILSVITLSHFLPSQSLLPEKRFLMFPNLAKAVGSLPLRDRLRRLQPVMHIFGHTHFAWDDAPPDLEGVRCIQAPLCYPQERRRRMRSIRIESDWQPTPAPSGDSPDAVDWLPLLVAKAHYHHTALAPGPQLEVLGKACNTASGNVPPAQGASVQHSNPDTPQAALDKLLETLPCLLLPELQQIQRTRQAVPRDDTSDAQAQQGSSDCRCQGLQGQVSILDWQLELCPDLDAMWSDHYKAQARTPEDVQLAPWVAPRYARNKARQGALSGDTAHKTGEETEMTRSTDEHEVLDAYP